MPETHLILHILGLVGCVFGIVSSYWDIQKARAMGGREGKEKPRGIHLLYHANSLRHSRSSHHRRRN